jgi:hypothetical protein
MMCRRKVNLCRDPAFGQRSAGYKTTAATPSPYLPFQKKRSPFPESLLNFIAPNTRHTVPKHPSRTT